MAPNGQTASGRGGFWSALNDADSEDDENGVSHHEELGVDNRDSEFIERDSPLDEEEIQLYRRRRKLKALVVASKKRADILASEVDVQVEEVVGREKDRTQMLEVLSRKSHGLRQQQEQRSQQILEEVYKLEQTTQECSVSQGRVGFFMQRIIDLLEKHVSSLGLSEIEALKKMREAENAMLRQLDDIRQQYEEVSSQNSELTNRLMAESNLTRRLSDQLAEAEDRFLRCGAGGDLQPPDSSRRSGYGSDRESLAEEDPGLHHALSNVGVPPLPLSRRRDASDVEVIPSGAEHPRGVTGRGDDAGDEERLSTLPEREEVASSRCWGVTALGPVAEGRGSSPSSGSGNEEMSECNQDDGAMDALLMKALGQVGFGYKVVRWHPGTYGFGGVKALVQLDHEGQLVAATEQDAEEGRGFLPIQQFLKDVEALAASKQQTLTEEGEDW
eukprot:TRINITY_DN18739_c0_g1_i2.p1 TRINITY_DN18739_c0_g1~~TRINITY_DN18739_c0_g1_i2.p1  ORF type:complete len:444 (+),score=96.79 TRINITY_DN18739_c0_g1_i2:41-1372(+)